MLNYTGVCFDSLSENFKTPIGAAAVGQEVSFRICLSKRAGCFAPRLLLYAEDQWDAPVSIIPMTLLRDELSEIWYQARFTPSVPNLLFYRFDTMCGDHRMPIMKDKQMGVGVIGCNDDHWQLTVYDQQAIVDTGLAGGIIYQIFPDRFYSSKKPKVQEFSDRFMANNWSDPPQWQPDETGEYRCNDYYGGDLLGITQKLPYIKSLGATAIYLNPIFEAHSNHRYNTADYLKIDPMLGSFEDFKELCAEAKALNIQVILDGVFSHVGSDSIYFNKENRYEGGAYQDQNSPFRSWFTFDEKGEYKGWWNFITLPEVRETDEHFLEFLTGKQGVLAHWIKAGASGFRLDVTDEIPDEALDKICSTIRAENPKAPIIGEVWEDASNKSSYGVRRKYLLGEQLNSVMNYPVGESILAFVRSGDYYSLYHTILSQQENYPQHIIHSLMNNISTHDTKRAITALVGKNDEGANREWQNAHTQLTPKEFDKGKKLLMLATVLQYFLPGVPSIYYGEEAGLYGYRDPFNRGTYPWDNEDQELVEWFKKLGEIRTSHRCLKNGKVSIVNMNSDRFFFKRSTPSQRLFVAVNRSETAISVVLPSDLNPKNAKLILGDSLSVIKPLSAVIVSY